MPRPLFQHSTEELATLFDEWRSDPAQLRILLDELNHRQRPRAVKLREDVEKALAGVRGTTTGPKVPPRTESSESEEKTGRESSSDKQGSYSKFTVIQPLGVCGRPSPFRPELLTDVRLDICEGDPLAKVYRVALAELIREMKRRKIGNRQFILEDGKAVNTEGKGFSYQFEFAEDANLFEGAQIEIVIGGRAMTGSLTAILQGRIIITLSEHFGSSIDQCILRIDNTALLQALHDRLQKIENGEVTSFRSDFASKVIANEGEANPAAQLTGNKCDGLNEEKLRFVRLALANEIAWLWGPPGTGKTKTLTLFTQLLYDQGKRILICSNTNQAVDQVLLQLCREMQSSRDPALGDGRIVRLGRIEHDDLRSEFEDVITIEGIVARKSEELQRRKRQVESELLRLGNDIAQAEAVLKQFLELDRAEREQRTAQDDFERAEAKRNENAEAARRAMFTRKTFQDELDKWASAGTFRRVFLRSEAAIRRDVASAEADIRRLNSKFVETEQILTARRRTLNEVDAALGEARHAVRPYDRAVLEVLVVECDKKRQPLRDELAHIATELGQIQAAVLKEARIVGATVTRTYLRPTEFAAFDAVIIDEASMIFLPAVFHAAGLATERVVVAGDFRQLPPIVQTEQEALHKTLSPDVFHTSKVARDADNGSPPRFSKLMTQYRMDEALCRPISAAFYKGRLQTATDRKAVPISLPEPFSQRLTIIDTSRIWPFASRNVFQSRFNLMHALTIRNVVLHLRDANVINDDDGRCTIGLCTPYAAQAKLLREVLKSYGLERTIRASTAHGFQGDERLVLVLDFVDSIGERNAGVFLQANQLDDVGAKLQNVAFSRAKEAIIIVANLTFLDAKLPGDAILRGLLHDIQRAGRIIDVRDVLALRPVFEDIGRFEPQPELDPEALRTGLFGGRDFARIARIDMEQAKKSIVIFSGFITPDRVAAMGDLLRRKIAEGVKVRCVTRPPSRNGSIPEELGRSALEALEGLGAIVDLHAEIHEKVVLIDGRIAWFGSLNPLSHTARTSELMARLDNTILAQHLAGLLGVRRRQADASESDGIVAENPRCERCGHWSVLIRGRFGLFFACENSECEWKQNVDAFRRQSRADKRQQAR